MSLWCVKCLQLTYLKSLIFQVSTFKEEITLIQTVYKNKCINLLNTLIYLVTQRDHYGTGHVCQDQSLMKRWLPEN